MVAIFLMILRVVLSIFLYAMLGFLVALIGASAIVLVFSYFSPEVQLELRQYPRSIAFILFMLLVFMGTHFYIFIIFAFFVLTLFSNNYNDLRLRYFSWMGFLLVSVATIYFAIYSFVDSAIGINGNFYWLNTIQMAFCALMALFLAILQFAAAFVAIRAVQFLRPCPKAQSPVAA